MKHVSAVPRFPHLHGKGAMAALIGSIMLMIGCEALLFGYSYPFFSLSMEEKGYSAFLIGMNASIGNVGIFVIGPFLPRMIRSAGVNSVVFAMFSVSAACFLWLLVNESSVTWFAIRFIMGACFAALWTSTEYWLNGVAPEAVRGRLIGASSVVYGLFQFIGPLLIGVFGVAGTLPVLVAAIPLCIGAVLALLTAVPKTSHGEDLEDEGIPRGWRDMLGPAAGLMALAFAAGVGETAMQSLLPLYGLAQKLSQSDAAGLVAVFSLGEATIVFGLGWMSDSFGRGRAVMLTAAVACLVLLMLSATPAGSGFGWLLLFLAGGTVSGLYALAVVVAGKELTGNDLAIVGTMLAMSYSLGSMLGTIPMGLMFDAWGPRTLPLGIAALFAGLFLYIACRSHEFGSHPPPNERA
jgi:MFS family permease